MLSGMAKQGNRHKRAMCRNPHCTIQIDTSSSTRSLQTGCPTPSIWLQLLQHPFGKHATSPRPRTLRYPLSAVAEPDGQPLFHHVFTPASIERLSKCLTLSHSTVTAVIGTIRSCVVLDHLSYVISGIEVPSRHPLFPLLTMFVVYTIWAEAFLDYMAYR
jgi:hypothetical protein